MKAWKVLIAGGAIAIAAFFTYAAFDSEQNLGEKVDEASEEVKDEIDDHR